MTFPAIRGSKGLLIEFRAPYLRKARAMYHCILLLYCVNTASQIEVLHLKPKFCPDLHVWAFRVQRVAIVPRGSNKDSGLKDHTLDGIWDQSPSILGTWTL